MKNTILTIVAFLMFASAAFSQGSVEGTITDAKGKGVANVNVTVVGANGKPVATVKTDADGAYTFDGIAAGKYKVAAYGAAGYDSAFKENVVVEDDDAATVDLTLAAELRNGGKTQTTTAWPTAKFAFELQYNVGGKTYKFFAAEITGLNSGIEDTQGRPADGSPVRMPGIKRYGIVTIKKGEFVGDNAMWDKFRQITSAQGAVRGTITIRFLDERKGVSMSWTLVKAFISNIKGDAAAIESMSIYHEGLSME